MRTRTDCVAPCLQDCVEIVLQLLDAGRHDLLVRREGERVEHRARDRPHLLRAGEDLLEHLNMCDR